MKTVKEVLDSASMNDILTNGELYWKVTEKDEELTIAQQYDKNSDKITTGIELWNSGAESLCYMPNLKISK